MASESRDEVRQRINNLYDQAENATGNYNATRAMNGGSRSRGVPLFKRQRTDDPGLDNIAREWFEGARAKLGPSVPAALPSDRMPERPGPRRPVSAMAADLLGQLEGSGPSRPALPAGPSAQSDVEVVRELPAERPKLELTAGPAAAVPASGPTPSSPPKALSAAAPRRTAPGTSKTKSQLKVAKARELLSQRTGQPAVAPHEAPRAPQPAPAVQPAQTSQSPWPMPETRVPAQEWSTAAVGIPAQRTDSGSFRTDALAGTGVLPAMTVTETGAIPPVPAMDTGGFRVMTPGAGAAQTMPPADTGSYRTMPPGAGAAAQAMNPMTDSGGFRVMTPGATDTTPATNPMTDSGGFRVMTPGATDTTPATNPMTDSGGFRVMTPGGTGTFPMPAPAPRDAGPAAAPSPADTGSFRIMTPGATGTFPMPSSASADSGAFPIVAPAPMPASAPAAAPAPAPIDTGSFQVMSPQAAAYAATYATAPAAAPGMGFPTGGYDSAAQAPTAVMPAVPAMPAYPPADLGMGAYPEAPAAGTAAAAYATGTQPAAPGYATAMPMTPPPAPMPTSVPMPMPVPVPSAPMPTAVAAAPVATPAAAMATAAAPVMTAPPMAPTPAVPVVNAVATAPASFPQAVAVAEPGKAMKALEFARAQIGRPCVWGATGPESYDCSSLTQAAWRAAGVTLPRTAPEQTLAGTPVTLAAVEPGDLVFFFDNDSHVGIYAGGGTMIHAPSPGASIREESIYNAGESAIHRVVRPA